jgi:hypothetical protein
MEDLETKYKDEYDKLHTFFKGRVPSNCSIRFNLDFFINFITYSYLLYLKTSLKYIEIIKELSNKFNMPFLLNDTMLEIQQYFAEVQNKVHLQKKEDEIVCRYVSKDECNNIRKKMSIRIELYKAGWDPEKIEAYIHKFIIKTKLDDSIKYQWYELIMANTFRKLNIDRDIPLLKVGRPPLPETIKTMIQEMRTMSIKENMRLKYRQSNEYENIKNCLLTEEEFKKVERVLDDENIINKLRGLIKRN